MQSTGFGRGSAYFRTVGHSKRIKLVAIFRFIKSKRKKPTVGAVIAAHGIIHQCQSESASPTTFFSFFILTFTAFPHKFSRANINTPLYYPNTYLSPIIYPTHQKGFTIVEKPTEKKFDFIGP